MDILIFTRFYSFAGLPVLPALQECLLYWVGQPNCHPLRKVGAWAHMQSTKTCELPHAGN
eukprot:35455-Prorocentrum_minimum.AAC.5